MSSKVLETQTIEQLSEATAVSEEAYTAVQEPGGKMNKLKIRRLLGKLISTNAAKTTEALLQADLAFAENSIALVYADPTPAKNGWYRKTGVSGAGTWTQFEKLGAQALAEVNAVIAQAEDAADRAEIAAANAAASSAMATGIYDPIAEFTGGAQGAYAVVELEYLFTDLAGTVNATADGDLIAVHEPVYKTHANFTMRHTDPAKRPILRRRGNLWVLEFPNGKGMVSAGTLTMKCPQTILCAAAFGGTSTQAFFGMIKNTNSSHYLASDSNDRVRAYGFANGTFEPINRPFKIATTADWSAPAGAMAVYHSSLLPGALSSRMDLGDSQAGNSPITAGNTWLDGDSVAGMTLAINHTGVAAPNANANCIVGGWMVIDKPLDNEAGVIEFFQQYTTIEMRPTDLSLFGMGDSTTDNEALQLEIFSYFALNCLVADNPDKDVIFRTWNRLSNCYSGQRLLTAGDKAERIFFTGASSAGAQPGYYLAERFDKVTDIPHVDERVCVQAHNMAVTEATSQNHPMAYLLRLGEFIEMEDQLREKWPDAPLLMNLTHPVRIPGDNRTKPVNASMQSLNNDIYHDIVFADTDAAFEAAGRNPALYVDDVHHSAAGVTLAGDTIIARYRTWVRPAKVTPPVLKRRRIPASEMIVPNGLFETWAAGAPTGLTATNVTVSRSVDEQLHGPSVKLVAPAAGDSFVQWDFNPAPLLDPTPGSFTIIVVTFWQLIKDGSDFETGRIQCGSNGTNNVGNSWIYNPIKSVETWEPRILHLPIPWDATTAFIRHWAGNGPAGVVHIDSMIPARGILPRDVLR